MIIAMLIGMVIFNPMNIRILILNWVSAHLSSIQSVVYLYWTKSRHTFLQSNLSQCNQLWLVIFQGCYNALRDFLTDQIPVIAIAIALLVIEVSQLTITYISNNMHDHLFVKLLSETLGCVYNVKYTFISNDNAC